LVIPGSTSLTLSLLGITLNVQPQITMLETGVNQNACEGAILDLSYTGTGTAADGTPSTGSGGSDRATDRVLTGTQTGTLTGTLTGL